MTHEIRRAHYLSEINNAAELREARHEIEFREWFAARRLTEDAYDFFTLENLVSIVAPPGSFIGRMIDGVGTGIAAAQGVLGLFSGWGRIGRSAHSAHSSHSARPAHSSRSASSRSARSRPDGHAARSRPAGHAATHAAHALSGRAAHPAHPASLVRKKAAAAHPSPRRRSGEIEVEVELE
jgi:hypothetical protein